MYTYIYICTYIIYIHVYMYSYIFVYIWKFWHPCTCRFEAQCEAQKQRHTPHATRNTHSTFPYVFLYCHTLHTCYCVWNSDTLTSVDPERNAEPPSNTTRNTHNTFFWRGGGGTPYGEKNTFVRKNIISRFYATVVHLRSARPSPLWKWISF